MPRPDTPLDLLFLRYGLERPSGFRPVEAGLLNKSYEVTSGGQRYFLKNYLPWRASGTGLPDAHGRMRSATDTLRWQHEAAAELAALGVPAGAPLRDPSGQSLVHMRGRPFALFPWHDGVHRAGRDLSLLEARHLGTTLARIHNGLAAVLPSVPQPLFVPTKAEELALHEAEQLLRRVRGRPFPDAFDELTEYRLCERRRLIPEVAHLRPGPAVLGPVGYIHGDFHMGNVFWNSAERNSRITAVIDWEKTAVGPTGDELVSAALVFFADKDTGLLDLDSVRAFVGGYASLRPQLSADGVRASVQRVWWERLTDFWIPVWRYELGDERADSLFPGTFALVPWWTENYDKVLEAFLDGAKPRTPRRASGASPLLAWLADAVTEAAAASVSPLPSAAGLAAAGGYR
jgi:Ser/Thr protein kinase RdoA (MazF antagonist)